MGYYNYRAVKGEYVTLCDAFFSYQHGASCASSRVSPTEEGKAVSA